MTNRWYIVSVAAGQENRVCNEINNIAKECDGIKEAIVPVKKVFKHVRGKKVDAAQKLFPNYVFVNMEMSDNSCAAIKDISKVLGFLGSKLKPEEVPDSKMEKLMNRVNEENDLSGESIFEVGDTVRIIEGPFETFTGVIESKDHEKNILKISVFIFGRSTMVDIEANMVEKIS